MIYDITPFTMTDYPDKLSAIVWFAGCNMRCIYCYNTHVVTSTNKITQKECEEFLKSRAGKLQAVVFSGGECTLSDSFMPLLKVAKKLGFLTKVDTNGSNLELLKEAIEERLIDYIALDFKSDKKNFKLITNSNLYEKFKATLLYLISINFPFEVRTTIHSDFIDEKMVSKMSKMLEELGYKGVYYLQNFLNTGDNFGCLSSPITKFDPKKINSNLKIELRNFS